MNLPDPGTFTFPAAIKLKSLNAGLKDSGMILEANPVEPEDGIVLDTFDSAVYHSHSILLQTDGRLIRICYKAGPTVQPAPKGSWKFAKDLPDGEIKTFLVSLCPLRALMSEGKIKLTLDTLRLLDDEKKTRCRIEVVCITREALSWTFMRTLPMRGYNAAHDLICDLLNKDAFPASPAEVLNLPISNYTAKPEIRLSPKVPIKTSLCAIVSAYLNVTRLNETGLANDIDTEFLHQWRVSLRKVRSVLTLFKGVVEAQTLDRLNQDFKTIMQDTNLMRDRDVYLLSREDYMAMVPPKAHPGLEILFDLLGQERNQAFEKVKAMLRSKAYKKQFKALQDLFNAPKTLPAGPKADAPSREFAAELILKRYKKVCKLAKAITAQTPDETIHDLRIQCKKLRYLIESSAPLFDPQKGKDLLKTLKGLQEHLGNFNDQSVQQVTLAQCLDRYAGKDETQKALAESIGALTAMLYTRQLAERQLIIDNLSQFYSPETRDAVNQLFDPKEA